VAGIGKGSVVVLEGDSLDPSLDRVRISRKGSSVTLEGSWVVDREVGVGAAVSVGGSTGLLIDCVDVSE